MKVAFSAPNAGTIADCETENPSAEAIRALTVQCASVNCPLGLSGILTTRSLILERIAPDDSIEATATYAMPSTGGRDRELTFNVDVAVFPKARLRARIDTCAPGETQWVVVNYTTAKV